MDIEKEICPSKNRLYLKGDALKTKIIDAELDVLNCEFDNGGCVVIDTKELAYITLTIENLEDLQWLIIEAETRYNKIFKSIK